MFFNIKADEYKESKPGLLLLKFILALLLLLVLWLLALPFVDKMLENFERTSVQQTVGQLNTALNFKIAEVIALDKLQELPQQLATNPIAWLDLDNLGGYGNYKGEVEELDFKQLQAGNWVFDRSENYLIYKVKYPGQLKSDDPVANRIQFKLALEYSDLDENGQLNAETDKISGITMVPVYAYQWFNSADQ
ncbi:MAG: hypothetical protein GY808_10720 [Gammaproteobacteria bacterium]|nr:hypothetical protein [Gammaproteobacteria bacterium]